VESQRAGKSYFPLPGLLWLIANINFLPGCLPLLLFVEVFLQLVIVTDVPHNILSDGPDYVGSRYSGNPMKIFFLNQGWERCGPREHLIWPASFYLPNLEYKIASK